MPRGKAIIDDVVGGLSWGPALLAICLFLVSAPVSADTPRDEARLERADALLADQSGWDEAIAIYRELVAGDPAWLEPRLDLARVLAWRGDYAESLDHYDRLAAAPSPPAGLSVERAEVLSWAGRNGEAAAAFERALEANPQDARAARGLARTERWSGERGRADRSYTRALALEDDREAREEQHALRAELRSEVAGSARAFFDSSHFSLYETRSRIARDVDFDTRLFASSATLLVGHDRESGAAFGGEPDGTRGFEGRLGVERRLGPRWKGSLETGGRHWDHADAVPLARGALEFAPVENTSLGLELGYDDLLERSNSLESVLENVHRGGAKLSVWRQLSPGVEAYAETGAGLLTDANRDLSTGASLSWRPFAEHDVHLALALDASGYRDHSEAYYSPELDLAATLAVAGKIPLRGPFAFTFDVGAGGGLSRELGLTETGPAYRAKLGLAFRRAGFSLDLDVARSESVRADAYVTHALELQASWSF